MRTEAVAEKFVPAIFSGAVPMPLGAESDVIVGGTAGGKGSAGSPRPPHAARSATELRSAG